MRPTLPSEKVESDVISALPRKAPVELHGETPLWFKASSAVTKERPSNLQKMVPLGFNPAFSFRQIKMNVKQKPECSLPSEDQAIAKRRPAGSGESDLK